MNKIAKYFVCFFACALFMFLAGTSKVSANYEANKNKIKVELTKEKMSINIEYQRGFGYERSNYWWCKADTADYNSEDFKTRCLDYNDTTYRSKAMQNYNTTAKDIISDKMAEEADANVTNQIFEITTENDSTLKIVANPTTANDGYYMLVVEGAFCAVRNYETDATGKVTFTDCRYYDNVIQPRVLIEIKNGVSTISKGGSVSSGEGTNYDFVSDSEMNSLLNEISDIVNDIVLPVLWVVLGLFLVVKGAILGVQIVKSADEPQVRQEKIGSLKWLIIGVAIAAIVTAGTSVLINLFKNRL